MKRTGSVVKTCLDGTAMPEPCTLLPLARHPRTWLIKYYYQGKLELDGPYRMNDVSLQEHDTIRAHLGH